MAGRLNWERDGADWPNREASRFITCGGLTWHIQQAGRGPRILLLQGTGASTHSWAGLLPLLAKRYEVLALDLPGHAFTTGMPEGGLTLEAMSRAIGHLLQQLNYAPAILIGHSAGAAIALRLATGMQPPPDKVIALNGALLPFDGVTGLVGPVMAKGLAATPLAAHIMARSARDPGRVARLIRSTGSEPAEPYLSLYRRLFADPGHVRGTLRMMAGWDLSGLLPSFQRAGLSFVQVACDGDRAVPPSLADDIARRYPCAEVRRVPGLGHLAHEEAPEGMATLLFSLLKESGPSRRKASA
ncbi:alpha/beta fold hydrolase BchO [Hyphomonas sp.]|uniref:alpha/beta fold hydrolase BchO n=1 Tax=Hyphomonas sp. TaxID=87 RepID=UPI003918B2FF